MTFPSVVRITLSAGATLLALAACSDSTTPRSHPQPPAPGVYVLRTLNGSPLPDDGAFPGIVTVAETLLVAPDESYTVAGAYYARYMSTTYRVTAPQTFRLSGDTVFAPTLNQGANGLGNFGEAIVTTRGDTVTASYSDYPSSGVAVFTRVANPTLPGPAASLLLWNTDTLLVQGGTMDVQKLVRRGLDANGLWIVRPPPTVSLTAPPGWTLSGSTLTAPATGESEATAGGLRYAAGTANRRTGDAASAARVHGGRSVHQNSIRRLAARGADGDPVGPHGHTALAHVILSGAALHARIPKVSHVR